MHLDKMPRQFAIVDLDQMIRSKTFEIQKRWERVGCCSNENHNKVQRVFAI